MASHIRLLVSLPIILALVLGSGLFLASRFLAKTPKAFAIVDETTLVVLKGEAQLLRDNGPPSKVTRDTEDAIVRAGDRVQTGSDSYACLVYLDGSTTELDPSTSIVIRRLDRLPSGAVSLSFLQESGQTWNRVERLKDPISRFETGVPSAGVSVRGAEYRMLVESNGRAAVETFTDSVTVEAAGASVELGAGLRTTVDPGQLPSPAEAISPSASRLRIEVQGPARPFLTDGHNRSVGFHPEGGAYGSQVPGATYRLAASLRTLLIPDPSNPYNLVLSPEGDGGNYTVNITALVGGRPVSTRAAGLARPLSLEMSGSLTRGQLVEMRFNVNGDQIDNLQSPEFVLGATDRSRVRHTRNQQGNASDVEQTSGPATATASPITASTPTALQ